MNTPKQYILLEPITHEQLLWFGDWYLMECRIYWA